MSTTDTVPTYYPMSVDEYIGWVKEHPGREFEVNFTGKPVARVRLPQHVPHGFHGDWITD